MNRDNDPSIGAWYRVFHLGKYPKPKKIYIGDRFATRQKARQYCRNRPLLDGLTIEHPDGTNEPFEGEQDES